MLSLFLFFFFFLGLKVLYNITQAPRHRVAQVLVRDTNNPKGGFAKLNDTLSYKIGMPSFISKGGGRFSFMNSITSTDLRNCSFF